MLVFANPTTPAALILSDMDRRITAVQDRLCAEQNAWDRAPAHRRRIDAGHRCLIISRPSGPAVVPLSDLSAAEIEALI